MELLGLLFLGCLQLKFLNNVSLAMITKGSDGFFLREFGVRRLENDFLSLRGFLVRYDEDVFLEVGGNNAIELFERRTDALCTASSSDAGHRYFVGVGLRFFSDSQLDHSKREKRKGSRDYFCHNSS